MKIRLPKPFTIGKTIIKDKKMMVSVKMKWWGIPFLLFTRCKPNNIITALLWPFMVMRAWYTIKRKYYGKTLG